MADEHDGTTNMDAPTAQPAGTEDDANQPALRADSSLVDAERSFHDFMLRKGFSDNTIKAFRNDLKILVEYLCLDKVLGPGARLLQVKTDHLNDFVYWLQYEREKDGRLVPCSPKSLARRITTAKVFFGWLHGIGVIGTDPADPVAQQPARPVEKQYLLTEEEVRRILRVAQDLVLNRQESDTRPYLLVNLLLQTGMKKAECARLLIGDLNISQPSAPEVIIRYADEEHAHKNRILALHPSIVSVLSQYLDEYKPATYLFECTPRNLEYVLDELGQRAGIKRPDPKFKVGFEVLRWTCAVRDFRLGMPEERLRLKMGLSKISWRETRAKIHALAGR